VTNTFLAGTAKNQTMIQGSTYLDKVHCLFQSSTQTSCGSRYQLFALSVIAISFCSLANRLHQTTLRALAPLWLQTYQRMKTASTSAPPGNCSCNNHCKAKYINIYLGSVEFLLKQRQNQRQKNVSVTAPDAYMTSASTAYIALDSLSFFFL